MWVRGDVREGNPRFEGIWGDIGRYRLFHIKATCVWQSTLSRSAFQTLASVCHKHARVILFYMCRTAMRLGEIRTESSESSLDKIKSINYSTPLPAPRETDTGALDLSMLAPH